MDVHYPPIESEATPEYVLAVLRDAYRQESGIDDKLFFDTTIEDWCDRWDWYSWRDLATSLNQWWNIDCTMDEWRAVLEPADIKCLHDVCNLIARHAHKLEIQPARMLGTTCRTAGAFLTVRYLLHNAGAPADDITPSTPLAPFTRKYANVFLGPITRLAPGAMPSMHVYAPVYDAALLGIAGGLLAAVLAGCVGVPLLAVGGFLVVLTCYALIWTVARWVHPTSIDFGALRTFRDLARVLANQN